MTSVIHRKEKIIFTAIEAINESGVQSLSTKKVAQMEGIAESTIFKHFKSKAEILSAVLDFYSQYDEDIIETIKINSIKGLPALKYFLDSYLRYYENYPAITAITQGLSEMRYIEELAGKVERILNNRTQCLLRIVREAQIESEISSRYDATTYVDAIMGSINGIIRTWRMEDMGFDLYSRCQNAVILIIGNGYPLEEVNMSVRTI